MNLCCSSLGSSDYRESPNMHQPEPTCKLRKVCKLSQSHGPQFGLNPWGAHALRGSMVDMMEMAPGFQVVA